MKRDEGTKEMATSVLVERGVELVSTERGCLVCVNLSTRMISCVWFVTPNGIKRG